MRTGGLHAYARDHTLGAKTVQRGVDNLRALYSPMANTTTRDATVIVQSRPFRREKSTLENEEDIRTTSSVEAKMRYKR